MSRLPCRPGRPTTILLDEIGEGRSEDSFDIDAKHLDLADADFEFDGPVGVTLRVVRSLQMFTVSGSLRAAVRGECCRCLAGARARVEAQMRFLLQRKEASEDEMAALEEEDEVDIVDPGVKEIDLAGRLHDAVVLEMPLRIYCKPDCLGLCSRCGEDLNRVACSCAEQVVDPRWEVLAQLKQQPSQGS